LEPGYIKGYVPGIRENGGQYTHAGVWAAMAFAMLGDAEHSWELFSMLNPINHAGEPTSTELYRVEPYVMCADIYGVPPHVGRGGWTWYTGAAGWMYRLAVETLVGVRLEVDKLRLIPRVPAEWESYKIHYRYRETFYHITVTRVGRGGVAAGGGLPAGPTAVGGAPLESGTWAESTTVAESVIRIVMDGTELEQSGDSRGAVPLLDDRRDHYVDVEFGRDDAGTSGT
jgi:cyclic beta-1,2-glucan glucanotransferase